MFEVYLLIGFAYGLFSLLSTLLDKTSMSILETVWVFVLEEWGFATKVFIFVTAFIIFVGIVALLFPIVVIFDIYRIVRRFKAKK